MINTIGIVGLGLMGASFGRLLVQRGFTVLATDKNETVMRKAKLAKAYVDVLTKENVASVDMLVVATFPRDFAKVITDYAPNMKKGAIVSDFCGNKRIVLGAMQAFAEKYKDLYFVGGHPMAGKELCGVEHSSVHLFDGASMILVPLSENIFTLAMLKEFYISLGFGGVVITDAEKHDKMIAYTSQLCHIVSNAFIKNETASAHGGFSAGSYKDLTRVARLNPNMWAELMQDNRDYLANELDELIVNLQKYSSALHSGDENALKELLTEGNERKKEIDKK